MTSSSDILESGFRHHQAGQFAEADRLYAQVLADEPQNAHALHLRGALAHAAGRNEDAVELISRAIAIDGKMPDSHYNLALRCGHSTGKRRQSAARTGPIRRLDCATARRR
jgi:Flp pilus assembly protein TadD